MLAVVVAIVAAGCGGSDFTYIANGTESLFFKVPKTWKVFRLTDTDKEGRPASLPDGIERAWHLVVDASQEPTVNHLGEEQPVAPVVEAAVYTLSEYASSAMSQSSLRTSLFGFDPIYNDPGIEEKWEVVSFDRLAYPKGVLGSRVVVNKPSETEPTIFSTTSGITVFDPIQRRVYIMRVFCESKCYLDNQKTIDEIAASWTVNR